jgi:hypothetical protein
MTTNYKVRNDRSLTVTARKGNAGMSACATKHRYHGESGQAVVMVTLALIAMCGMMGLAVDVGWSYFIRKAEHGAADAAALAAVRQAVSNGCRPPANISACPSGGLPAIATHYLNENGFTAGSHVTISGTSGSGRPSWLSSSLNSCSSTVTAPCVWYYVNVYVSDSVPQLFSAVLGHPLANVAVSSTAVIAQELVNGSLVLTNRSLDTVPSALSPALVRGTDLSIGSCSGAFFGFCFTWGFGVQANMGVVLSSICGGSNCSGAYAGNLTTGFFGIGAGSLAAPFTQILGTNQQGWVNNTGAWQATPINVAAGNQFGDPFSGAGQPPVPASAISTCPATVCTNGGLALPTTAIAGGTSSSPKVLPPGGYWVANSGCTGSKCTATGAPMTLGSGYFEFVDSSSVNTFSTYIFYGGLSIGASTHVTFGPGMYILAGSNQSCSGGAPCPEISITPGAQICDGPLNNPFCGQTWQIPASNAGEIFIFTGANSNGGALTYPGLPTIPARVSTCACLTYGQAGFAFTGNGSTAIDLHGLNASNSNLPATGSSSLQPFAPVFMWQDQANSYIKYNANGSINVSCGSLNSPCTNTPLNALAPQMNLTMGFQNPFFSAASGNFSGAIYQPRGAWINLALDGSIAEPDPVAMQVITGAAIVQPAPVSILSPLILDNMINPPQVTRIATAMVE